LDWEWNRIGDLQVLPLTLSGKKRATSVAVDLDWEWNRIGDLQVLPLTLSGKKRATSVAVVKGPKEGFVVADIVGLASWLVG